MKRKRSTSKLLKCGVGGEWTKISWKDRVTDVEVLTQNGKMRLIKNVIKRR